MNINDIIAESQHKCPHCGEPVFEYSELGEGKKDACYYKVKASAKVWPSAYASGRLVQCRKKGAANYGNKNESSFNEEETGNVDDADSWQSQQADARRAAETNKMSQQDAAAGGLAEGSEMLSLDDKIKIYSKHKSQAQQAENRGDYTTADKHKKQASRIYSNIVNLHFGDDGKDAQNAANEYIRKSQGVAGGKIKLSTDPNWYGAEIGDYKASGPVVNIPANRLVGFEPDDKMNQPASKANVEKIVAGLKQGAKLPPLMVRQYKNGYQVLDGHHRFWAYKLLGVKSIPAQVVPAEDIEEITKQGVAEGSKESYMIIRTDAEGKKDVFAGNFDTYERAQKELDGLLDHPLHTKYKQKFEIKRKGGEQSVAENFADGRNPQDKGDSKRHGINTKASVSSLRKTAKQGGRKGQLAHWLANMKAGRAKNEDVTKDGDPQLLFYAKLPEGTKVYARVKDAEQLADLQQQYRGAEIKTFDFRRPDVQKWLEARRINLRKFTLGMVQTMYDVMEAAHTANFNDDDWYEINPDTNTIVSQRGPQAYQVPFGQRQINLPNGNIVVRGMRAKGMGLDTGLDKPQQKEDGTWGAL